MKPGDPVWWFRWTKGGHGTYDKFKATFVCLLSHRVRIRTEDGLTRSVNPGSVELRKENEPRGMLEGDPIFWFRSYPGQRSERIEAVFLGVCGRKIKILLASGGTTLVYPENIEPRKIA